MSINITYQMDITPGLRGHTFEVFRVDVHSGERTPIARGGSGSMTREEAEAQAKQIARNDREIPQTETIDLNLDS
jgi:hypothetical protein